MLYNKLASRRVLTARGIFIDMNILIEILTKNGIFCKARNTFISIVNIFTVCEEMRIEIRKSDYRKYCKTSECVVFWYCRIRRAITFGR